MFPPILEWAAWSNADIYWFYFWVIALAAAAMGVAPFLLTLPPDPEKPKPERLRKIAAAIRTQGRRLAAFLLR